MHMVRAKRAAKKRGKSPSRIPSKVSETSTERSVDSNYPSMKRSASDLWKTARAKGIAVARLSSVVKKDHCKAPLTREAVRKTCIHLRLNELEGDTANIKSDLKALRNDVTDMKDMLEALKQSVEEHNLRNRA